jgi:hypothetical protein
MLFSKTTCREILSIVQVNILALLEGVWAGLVGPAGLHVGRAAEAGHVGSSE